jgi:hypothetical protein
MYPFEYQLPPNLPGVINIRSGGTAKIRYKLKATLQVNGFFSSDLKGELSLVVHSQLSQRVQASEDSTSESVNLLCCFYRGTCHLKVAMDKNVYLPGETSQIQCTIQNESTQEIARMQCKLYQMVTLRTRSGSRTNWTSKITERNFDGVPANTTIDQPQPVQLISHSKDHPVLPSTRGALITCEYYIDLQCDIAWCPDIHLHLPVTIITPVVPSKAWAPPSSTEFVHSDTVDKPAKAPAPAKPAPIAV